MPPKPKRTPHPALHHLKHSRQLLEDFLYQYLPQLSSMGSLSRINVYTWCNSRWGLSPDGKQGLPFMVLEALRLQRQHLLQHLLLQRLRIPRLRHQEMIGAAFERVGAALQCRRKMRIQEVGDEHGDDRGAARAQARREAVDHIPRLRH
ncbi:MAG: hypothetical protein KY428_01365, partial [Bacteroidetes bacterium]|nr:hypothetical protein [Bacteroidota bacterium]